MSRWEELIERYKDSRKVCNCRQAYYTDGTEITYTLKGESKKTEPNVCMYGCQINQLTVKEYIAEKVLAELKIKTEGK